MYLYRNKLLAIYKPKIAIKREQTLKQTTPPLFSEFQSTENFDSKNYLNSVNNYEQIKVYKEFALNLMKLKPDNRLLEVGCGVGCFLQDVLKFYSGIKIIGIDNNADMIKICKKKMAHNKNVILKKVDVLELSNYFQKPSQFDVIFIDRVMQHISPTNLYTALKQIRRVCKSKVIICDTDYTLVDIKPESDISKKIVQYYRSNLVHNPDFAANAERVLKELDFEIKSSHVFPIEYKNYTQAMQVGAFEELMFPKLKENNVLTDKEIDSWKFQMKQASEDNKLSFFVPIKVVEAQKI